MKSLLFLTCLLAIIPGLHAQDSISEICLDQVGFYPNAPKTAILRGFTGKIAGFPIGKVYFYVTRTKSLDTVYRGELSAIRFSTNSSLQTRIADFSTLNQTGTFQVSVAGFSPSYPFEIKEKVHCPVAVASLKAFYFQRASMALEPSFAGKWSRPAGHPDTASHIHPSAVSPKRKEGSTISTPGGWYDAGDYNKYIVNAGITMGTLLSAYEDFKPYFDTLQTNIPALSRPVPDILNEILYNLRWMLSMQDPEDGGVYNKCTNAAFDEMVMPDAARQPRYVVQKSTAATLDFAAVVAQAARVFASFKKELPGLSDSCLFAAEKAWIWSQAHPALAYDQEKMNKQFTPKISTGGYGDGIFTDEWFWAASELMITTGRKKYQDTVIKYVHQSFGLPSWSSTGLLGYYSLIRKARGSTLQKEYDFIRLQLWSMADEYLKAAENNAFQTVMGGRRTDFNWGSNSNAANQGILMLQVFFITKNRKYLDAALGNLEYICGRNARGYCYITGFGSYSPKHPHHRPSVADGIADPVPGLLAGGPNPGEQDHCHYDFHEAETAYLDSDCAYASNEIAINWNAPLVYLANAIEALENNF